MLKQIDGKIEVAALFIVKRLYTRCIPKGVKDLSKVPFIDFKQFNGNKSIPFDDTEVKEVIHELS